jgi:flagellar hook-associated protein 1 FlgK
VGTFSGISASLTALHANQRGMEVTANNIANVNTEGYSRQRVALTEIGGPSVPGVHAQARPVGDGVMIEKVERLRDGFLESRGRVEHAQGAYLQGQQQALDRIQTAFAEPGDTALQAQMNDMWGAFGDVANKPNDQATRSALIARATVVADSMRSTSGQLASVWDTTHEQLGALVSEINATSRTVAELNQSVVANSNHGQPANDLADKRDLAVMKLAQLTGAAATPRPDGSVDVLLGGSVLVSGSVSRQLLPPSGGGDLGDAKLGTLVDVRWADGSNAKVTASSGKLAATLETLNSTLPGYGKRLDEVAGNLAARMNTEHGRGQTDVGAAGGTFFGPPPPDAVSAANIRMEITDPADLAIADAGADVGSKDGTNADRMAELAKEPGGPDRKYRQLVVDLGVQAQAVDRRAEIQGNIVREVDAQRAGESGVNLDEEMSNLIQFERAYQAAAKVISTIDDMLDTLINRM